MQLAKIPHTSHRVPPLRQAQISQHGTNRGRNKYRQSAHTTESKALGQLPGAQKHV